MKDIFKALKKSGVGLLESRKFLAAVLSAVAWGVGKFGAELDTEELLPLVAPLWGYIVTMLGADWGKHKAEIEAKAANESATPDIPPRA